MTLDEFVVDFYENAELSKDPEGLLEDAITVDILEYIKDCGEVLEPQLCNIKGRGYKINAIDYDDDNESVDLFVTIPNNDCKIQKLSDKLVTEAFEKAEKFYLTVKTGNVLEKIEKGNEHLADLISIVQQTKAFVKNVRIFLLTNFICSAKIAPKDKQENEIVWDYELWDIERGYQQYLIKAGKQKIEVDFESTYQYKLKCLQMESVSEKVDEYLAILPASILADIYGKHKQALLEKNIRNFLHFKTKVNNGIRDTIRNEPDMFFAYNNGISTTAESVDVHYEKEGQYIKKLENLQIVNGGQTTASIYYTSTDANIDLTKVFVPMKISVVKADANINDVVPKISQFANSQTIIKQSDFSSNSVYHLRLEELSRTTFIPASTGVKSTSKWYYERTRGQYLDERSRKITKTDKNSFDTEYPKKQKFDKIELSKFEMSWWQRPHDVSKGGEKHFPLFTKEVETSKIEVTEVYYKNLITKGILFHAIEKSYTAKKLGSYRAIVVTYVLSWLSYKTAGKLNLLALWDQQEVTSNILLTINQMIDIVWPHINNPSKTGMNVTDWHKKPECWLSLKDKYIDISILNEQLDNTSVNGVVQQLTDSEIKWIEDASLYSGELWYALSKWAKEKNLFSPFDRKLAYNLGVLKNRKTKLSPKQAKNAIRIMKEAAKEGFVFNGMIATTIPLAQQ